MDRSMLLAVFIVVLIFGGIAVYAFEFTSISNYLNPIDLLKRSLFIALPLSSLVSYSLYKDSRWVRPLVYRVMAFFSVIIFILSPLAVHLVNFHLDSRLLETNAVRLEKVNGVVASRFGAFENKKPQKSDYYHLALLDDKEGRINYRMDEVTPGVLQDTLILQIYLGFLGIPYYQISNGGSQ